MLEAEVFIGSACAELGISVGELTTRSRKKDIAELRFLVVGLGIERWGQKAGEIAGIFGRRPDLVSWWVKRGRELRLSDPEGAERSLSLDEGLRSRHCDERKKLSQ